MLCGETSEDGYVEYPSFITKEDETITHENGGWSYKKIGVYQIDAAGAEPKLLGQYIRTYPSFYNTFAYTRKGDKYYALYSPEYTGTRVLEITPNVGIKDIGGEERNPNGFCPVDYYIPVLEKWVSENYHTGPGEKIKDWDKLLDYFPPGTRIQSVERESVGRQKIRYEDGIDVRAYQGVPSRHNPNEESYKWVWGPEKTYRSVNLILPSHHAFVAGCIWGDDSSWKVQHLDISRIDEGIITRDKRFGYIELPENVPLSKAINFDDFEESDGRFSLAVQLHFHIDGGIIDWHDIKGEFDKGQAFIDKQNQRWKAFREAHPEESYKTRWYGPEGEAIRKMVEETGGEYK